jgi:hypothetical protein
VDSFLKVLTDSELGSAASVIGLVVTMIGFAITIYNVLRSKRAAEQTKKEVDRVRHELSRRDAIADMTTVIITMEEVKRLHRQQAWAILPERYSSLRRQLISIKASLVNLTDPQKAALQGAIQQLASHEALLDRTPQAELNERNVAKLNRSISVQIDGLEEVLAELRTAPEVSP